MNSIGPLFLLLLCTSVGARPANLIAAAYERADAAQFYKHLSSDEQKEYNDVARVFRKMLVAGIPTTFHDFVRLSNAQYPELHEKLVVHEMEMNDREKTLPEAVRKFVNARRSEVDSWFLDGELNEPAFVRSVKLTASDISEMTDSDKAALFEFYPHMKELLENKHFQKFLAHPDGINDNLRAILVSSEEE
uniref:Fatty-acid and retinol-binding protein 1 n=1 Tax=Steinernema glaseri TaxID=37863 RepID=A0A1I7YTI7_9BILA